MSETTVTLPPVTQETLRAYAEASGDPNPIHLDEAAAKAMGLPGIIAHGMLSAAWVAERAITFAGEEWLLREFQSRFKAMVFPGDALIVSCTQREVTDKRLVLELRARNGKAETVTLGVATFERATS